MHELYFKKSTIDDRNGTAFFYTRSKSMMTGVDLDGKLIHDFYNPGKFISAYDYFRTARYIGKIARRVKTIKLNDDIEDISYMNDEFELLYASDDLGIIYSEEAGYEIVPKEYIDGYDSGSWELSYLSATCNSNPKYIVKEMLSKNYRALSKIRIFSSTR